MIRIVLAATGTVAAFAGNGGMGDLGDGGYAVQASIAGPRGIAVLPDGSVLISDNFSNKVRVVKRDGTIDTWMGTGSAGSGGDGLHRRAANVDWPLRLHVHPDTADVFVGEMISGRIRRVDGRTGIVSTFVGPIGSNASVILALSSVHDMLALPGSTEALIVAEAGNGRVWLLNAAAGMAMLLAGVGSNTAFTGVIGDNIPATIMHLARTSGLLYHAPSRSVLVTEWGVTGQSRLRAFPIGGNMTTVAGENTNATLNVPRGIAWHPAGHIIVAEYGGNRVTAIAAGCLPAAIPVS